MARQASIRPITAAILALLCLGPAPDGSVAAEAACRPDAPFALSFDGDRLGLTSDQACLEAILRELERQAPVTIHLPPSLSREAVSESFSGLPLGEAIARILDRTSYLLLTKPPEGPSPPRTAGASHPFEIWIVGRRSSSAAEADRESDRAGLLERARDMLAMDREQLIILALEAPDPQQRADAVALLVHVEKDPAVADTILMALEDRDPRVREAALHIVADLGAEAPGAAAAIAHMARRDDSPNLRMRALETLFAANYRRDLARETVLAAREDPEPDVRALAENLMELVSPHGTGD